MKRTLALVACLLGMLSVGAAAEFEDCLYPARIGGKWGYVDYHGEVVLEPKWLYAGVFRGAGYAAVEGGSTDSDRSDGCHQGIIDKQGNYALEPMYSLWEGDHGEYFGGRDTGIIQYNAGELMGFFDVTTGFCSGLKYWEISLRQDPDARLICVSPSDTWRKVGFVDRATGEWVIPPIYDYNHAMPTLFCRGYAVVSFIDEEEGTETYAIIDETGAEIAPPEGFAVTYHGFREGLASVEHLESGLYGYMDGTGALVIPAIFTWTRTFDQNGTAHAEIGDKAVVIDKTGAILDDETVAALTPVKRVEYSRLSDDMNQYGCVTVRDASGKVLIPASAGYRHDNNDFHYEEGYFTERYQALSLNGKWGYIDERGEPITAFIYDDAYEFHNGLAMVKKDGKYAYINYAGETVWREP